MRFSLNRRYNDKNPHHTSQDTTRKNPINKPINAKTPLISIACALILTASSSVFADAHFGIGLSDGDTNVTWVENDVSVDDDIKVKTDDRWNAKEDDLSIVDYEAYMKSFKLFMVFKRNF